MNAILFALMTLQILFHPAVEMDPAVPPMTDSYSGSVLCLPDVYENITRDCLISGPAAYLTRLKKLGVTFPLKPLPAFPPDRKLAYVSYRYARVTTPNAPVYRTVEDAIERKPVKRRIEPGFNFISYTESVEIQGNKYYRIAADEWIWAGDIARTSPPLFQGLEFYRTPERPFAWILYPTETKQTPGYQEKDYTGHYLYRYEVVQIYATQQVGDYEWYMINPDEWVEQRLVARVIPRSNPPEGVTNGRWIEVNLFEQTVAVYENNRLIFATLASTGLPGWWTRPGLFQIHTKLESTPMRGAFEIDRSDFYSLEDVPWTMYFDEARALHGAYWHNGFGYPRSHGCVNLSPGDAHWIFNWAKEGDWVNVWDPSGETPVDPDLYTAGGA